MFREIHHPAMYALRPTRALAMVVPSRPLHALPSGTPNAEVGHTRAVGSPQHPDSRVGGIQAVARRQACFSSFPSAHRVVTVARAED
jgi:hypothetical protein